MEQSQQQLSNILVDASWWLGGNRNRGIGKYLEYLFLHDELLAQKKLFWLFPKKLSKFQADEFSKKFPGEIIEFEIYQLLKNKQERYKQLLEHYQIQEIFISSPFERPWSLLNDIEFFENIGVQTSAVIFDLIPMQLEKEVLNSWPKYQQISYKNNLKNLRKLNNLYCISPFTKDAVEKLLNPKKQKVTIIEFGLKTDWLEIAETTATSKTQNQILSQNKISQSIKLLPVTKKLPLAVTITGGDPRKNLAGTLEYFAKKLAKDHTLIVICKLGWTERFQYHWQTWRMGIVNKVAFVGEVSEIRKWQYLKDCDVFLFLSKAEGLGIPLLEAKKAGVKKFVLSKELYQQGFASVLNLPETITAE